MAQQQSNIKFFAPRRAPAWGLREIRLQSGGNVRDLGGYPTRDGGVTKPGVAYRATSPAELTEQDRRALRALGLAAHIDLRSSFEIAALGEADFGDPRIRPVRVPVIEADDPVEYARRLANGARSSADPDAARQAAYRRMLDEAGSVLAAAFSVAATDIPTVHHCSTGRDRTGLLSALLLRVADVPDALIAWDYTLSSAAPTAELARLRTALSELLSDPVAARSAWPPPDGRGMAILHALAHLDRRWGGAEAYLIDHGVKRDQISALLDIFVLADR